MARKSSRSAVTAYPLFLYLLIRRWTLQQAKGKGRRGRPEIAIQSTAAISSLLILFAKFVNNNKSSINNYSQALLLKALYSFFTGNKSDNNNNKIKHDFAAPSSKIYTVKEQPFGTRRPIKVIILGAGASAINLLKCAETEMTNVTFTCYEKNSDIGGTWFENRYPGCACDIPSVNYQFTWKIKIWNHYYSPGKEIWQYLKDIEQENGLVGKYIQLRHKIETAKWDEEAGLWRLTIRNLQTNELLEDAADFFINAGGILNKWKWPNIDGLHDFKGKLMHSANYDAEHDISEQRVAIIGAGSSGVQIMTATQPKAKKVFHWVKSPIWITAGFAQRWAGTDGANFEYTKKQRQYLEEHPEKYLEYRKQIENEICQRFRFVIKGSREANDAKVYSESEMRRKLKDDQRLCDKIIPKTFNPGCRRPTPAPGYLESLTAPNAVVYTDPITKVDATGFVDHKGKHHKVDTIICATGFDTSWIPPFTLTGEDNVPLNDLWTAEEGVTSYLSVAIPHFPNYFTFGGPYGTLAHGSFMPLIELWTSYVFAIITKAQIEGIKSIAPSARATAHFRQHADTFNKRTVWTQPCASWFKQGKVDGQTAIYPGSRAHYMELLKAPRYEDFVIEYLEENTFTFLGNGFSVREEDGSDVTRHIGSMEADGRDVQPKWDEHLIDVLGGSHAKG